MNRISIHGSTALVTGANRGLGRSLVAALLERGAVKVYATARRTDELEEVRNFDRGRVVAAAAWSLTQSMRADLGRQGVSVFGVFPGAVDTDMLRGVEMAKTPAGVVAAATLDGLAAGTEDIFPDPMSQALYAQWVTDHKAVERQLAAM